MAEVFFILPSHITQLSQGVMAKTSGAFSIEGCRGFLDVISKAAYKKMLLGHLPTCNFHMQLVRYFSDVEECKGLTKNRFTWIFTFCDWL